ncbi:MAG: phytanoyl-CoA dioxygenase family protein [Candidatus Latescibacteria bacterium]|jgi:ectoine hydroxylase-related dioxygenase (phytanoyl-CoA dioxygenase family)|nr:phytanoyl-CoA dioxygenase family protein [Candidatus Latescibacterota bacterium]
MADLAVAHKRNELAENQVDFYHENGYLHIPQVFTADEIDTMADELDWQIETWANRSAGWSGPWRKVYMDEATEKQSKLIALHDLHRYSKAWCDAVTNDRLTGAIADLIGPNVELHHTTLHAKPPGTGHPFPMHQDWAFYEHIDGRYVDCLIHLDDTNDENGCIRFLAGSHKQGALKHVRQFPDGTRCTPHLPTSEYDLEDTVPVPAKRGDVVVFCIHTIHGSRINQTPQIRRMVRVGYRDPDNEQIGGQSKGRPGLLVQGRRDRYEGMMPNPTNV